MADCTLTVAGQPFAVEAGTPLHMALASGGVPVETPCGARGYCRKCRVKITGDVPTPKPADLEHLSPAELDLGYRLSCQHLVSGDLTIAIMPESMADPKKAAMGRLSGEVPVDPWVPQRLLDSVARPTGLALDIGTTGVVAALLDLRTGEELAAASVPNPQAVHGGDLMSRLTYAGTGLEARRELRTLIINAINEQVEKLCRRSGREANEIIAATMVGNTAMHHLFLGLPIESLALAPYVPALTAGKESPAARIGLKLHPEAILYTLPVLAGFVGADCLAAGMATGLDEDGPTVLMADIGTNGEVLLRHGGKVYGCSAPAGPAFEGGELYMGMRANPGAIQAVGYSAETGLVLDVIKGGPARGICGSGLLDAAATLLAHQGMNYLGRLQAEGPLAPYIRTGDWGDGFVLAEGDAAAEGRTVVLSQKDIRQLQLAKGAIRSGIDLLLVVANLTPADVDAVLLAGAFGNYLRRESAIAIGLIPGVPVAKVVPVGNAAAQGAKLALLSRSHRERVERLGRTAIFVDLAQHKDFEQIFMDALNFPRT